MYFSCLSDRGGSLAVTAVWCRLVVGGQKGRGRGGGERGEGSPISPVGGGRCSSWESHRRRLLLRTPRGGSGVTEVGMERLRLTRASRVRLEHWPFLLTPSQGNSAGTALLAFMFLFSGFFIPYESVPSGWQWFTSLSMFKYPLEGMVLNMLDEEVEEGDLTQVRRPSRTPYGGVERRGFHVTPHAYSSCRGRRGSIPGQEGVRVERGLIGWLFCK